MRKSILFSVLAFSTALALVGCKSNQNEPEAGGSSDGKSNGHEYVNLGLSVKWATCNVGANSHDGYGNYYAWGETATKATYDWDTYFDVPPGYEGIKYSGDTVLVPEDDAAHVNWGGSWRMPTEAEWQELLDNCTWTWTTQNGINGYKVTSNKAGYTNKFIFLPAAGLRFDSNLEDVGSHGYYWSSSLSKYNMRNPYGLYFNLISPDLNDICGERCFGQSVRPVLP